MEIQTKNRLKNFLVNSAWLLDKRSEALDRLEALRPEEADDFLGFIFEGVKNEVLEISSGNDVGRARELSTLFSPLIKQYLKPDSKLLTNYREFIRELQFKAFSFLPIKDRAASVREATVWALKKELSVKTIFEDYFLGWTADRPENNFPELTALTRQLEQNEELIGEPRLKLDLAEEKLARPTVKNWLIKYKLQIGTRESALSMATFLTKFPPIKELADADKKILEQLLSIYFWLRNPLATVTERSVVETRRTVTAPVAPKVAAPPVVVSPPQPVTLLEEVLGKITRGDFNKKKLAAYLKVVLPKPVDFKKVLGFVNELKRRGYPDFMDIIYFDPTDGQYHWSE